MVEMRKRIKELEDEIKFLQGKESETKCQNCNILKSEYEKLEEQIDLMQEQIFSKDKYLHEL